MASDERNDKGDSIPLAKRHSILQDITKQMTGFELDTTVEVSGHRYYMTTLNSEEEMWADGIMQINSPAQAVSSFRLSRLAASIKKIDDVPVSDMFDFPEKMDEDTKTQYSSSNYGRRTWQMGQLYLWLSELPMPIVDEIAEGYQKISKKRKESLGELKNSFARTSGGESKDSSSPVKESSQAVQM